MTTPYVLETPGKEGGAYIAVTSEFLELFTETYKNSNFEVFDKMLDKNTAVRVILAWCSRFPDDEDPDRGVYGLNFNKRAPTLEEAKTFYKKISEYDIEAANKYLNRVAFAAHNKAEYKTKKEIYDKFFSFLFGEPMIVYAAPHSGFIARRSDIIVPDPKDEIDRWSAGTAAICGVKEGRKPSKREAHSIHTSNDQFKSYPAIIDMGTYGLMDEKQLEIIRRISEDASRKHRERITGHQKEYKERVYDASEKKLEEILNVRGTLDPEKLVSERDKFNVNGILKRLGDYHETVGIYNLESYLNAINRAIKSDEPRIIPNHIFPGKKVGKDLRLSERIKQGKLELALQYECSRFYMEKDQELVADMVLDIAKEAAEAFRS